MELVGFDLLDEAWKAISVTRYLAFLDGSGWHGPWDELNSHLCDLFSVDITSRSLIEGEGTYSGHELAGAIWRS